MEAKTLSYVESMIRYTRATAERIRQKKERQLMLYMAQTDDIPRLKTLFKLWDSLPYMDADEKPMTNEMDIEVSDEPQSLGLPTDTMGSGDARVVEWLSKLPIPQKRTWLIEDVNVLPTITEEDEKEMSKKFSLRRLFSRFRCSLRRSMGNM